MGVVGCASERPGSPTGGGTFNSASFERKYRVQVDDLADGPVIVTGACGLPKLGRYYQFGNEVHHYALCRELTAERVQPASLYWEVTASYETPTRANRALGYPHEVPGESDNPLLQLAEVETSFEKFQQVVYYIYDVTTGRIAPATASNDQVYDPPPMMDASRLIMTITRNEPLTALHPALGIAFMDSVNSDTFWGGLAGTWKVQGISAQRQTKQLPGDVVLAYLRVSYKFEARPTWDLQILDAGTYRYDSSIRSATRVRLAFLTSDGHPRTGALDGTGLALPDGATPVFNVYRVYKRQPFAILGLPQSYTDVA
jgi:hypothetical protein